MVGHIGGTPTWNTYQEERCMCALTWIGEWGSWWVVHVGGMGQGRVYLSCRAGVSCRMLSQMCVNWYSLQFLFNEGSFTQMNMTSLMFLDVPCDSLCMIVKYSGLSGWPVELLCWWMEDGALRHSLILSQSALPDSPMYSSGQLYVGIWIGR